MAVFCTKKSFRVIIKWPKFNEFNTVPLTFLLSRTIAVSSFYFTGLLLRLTYARSPRDGKFGILKFYDRQCTT